MLAANEGVEEKVQVAIEDTLSNVQSCAQQNDHYTEDVSNRYSYAYSILEGSYDECTALLLDIVVRLSRNRIYGRLGSSKQLKSQPSRGKDEVMAFKTQEGFRLE